MKPYWEIALGRCLCPWLILPCFSAGNLPSSLIGRDNSPDDSWLLLERPSYGTDPLCGSAAWKTPSTYLVLQCGCWVFHCQYFASQSSFQRCLSYPQPLLEWLEHLSFFWLHLLTVVPEYWGATAHGASVGQAPTLIWQIFFYKNPLFLWEYRTSLWLT